MWEYKKVYDRLSAHRLLSKCEEEGADGWELISVVYEVEEILRDAGMDNHPLLGQWVGVLRRKKSSVMMWEYKDVSNQQSHLLLLECEEKGADGWELISVTREADEVDRETGLYNYPVLGYWVAILKRKKSS